MRDGISFTNQTTNCNHHTHRVQRDQTYVKERKYSGNPEFASPTFLVLTSAADVEVIKSTSTPNRLTGVYFQYDGLDWGTPLAPVHILRWGLGQWCILHLADPTWSRMHRSLSLSFSLTWGFLNSWNPLDAHFRNSSFLCLLFFDVALLPLL